VRKTIDDQKAENVLERKLKQAKAAVAEGHENAAHEQFDRFFRRLRSLTQNGRIDPDTAESLRECGHTLEDKVVKD